MRSSGGGALIPFQARRTPSRCIDEAHPDPDEELPSGAQAARHTSRRRPGDPVRTPFGGPPRKPLFRL